MGNYLILSEKGGEARLLASLLVGTDYKEKSSHLELQYNGQNLYVAYSDGHLYRTRQPHEYDPALKRWNLDQLPMVVPEISEDSYLPDEGRKARLIANLKSLCKICDTFVIATDKDDQGQFIGNLIVSKMQFKGTVKRWKSSVLTETQVKKDFASISELPDNAQFDKVAYSEMIRNLTDAYMGFNLTRLYTLLMQQKYPESKAILAIGRVQTTLLGIVARRHEERLNFKSHGKHRIQARCRVNGKIVKFDSKQEYLSKEAASNAIAAISRNGTVTKVVNKIVNIPAPSPLYLSSLQEYMGKHFKYKAEDVKRAAEKNYLAGYMTYPRTDSPKIEYKYWETASELLTPLMSEFGVDEKNVDFSRKSQYILSQTAPEPAHAALIPTSQTWAQAKTGIAWEVYKACALHFLAQFMPEKSVENSAIELNIDGELFSIKGKRTVSDGWSGILEARSSEVALPEIQEGEIIKDVSLTASKIASKRPSLYKDYELLVILDKVGEMLSPENEALAKFFLRVDKKGIGSPATRSDGLVNVIRHQLIGIVEDSGSEFLDVTEDGYALFKALRSDITRPDLFAKWERYFFEVASGRVEPKLVYEQITSVIKAIVTETKKDPKTHFNYVSNKRIITGFSCDKCGTDMIKRERPYVYWACQGCDHKAPDYKDEPCPTLDGDGDACTKDGCEGVLRTAAGLKRRDQTPWKALRCDTCRSYK